MSIHTAECVLDDDAFPPLKWWEIPSVIIIALLALGLLVVAGAGMLYLLCSVGSYIFHLTTNGAFGPFLGASLFGWLIIGSMLIAIRGPRR